MDLNSAGGMEQLRRMIIREPVWRDSPSPSHLHSLGEKEGSLLALKEGEGGRKTTATTGTARAGGAVKDGVRAVIIRAALLIKSSQSRTSLCIH